MTGDEMKAVVAVEGLTRRDWFAGQAVSVVIAREGVTKTKEEVARVLKTVYAVADAMMRASRQHESKVVGVEGPTQRDWFASQAVSGLFARMGVTLEHAEELAPLAYVVADAMMASNGHQSK